MIPLVASLRNTGVVAPIPAPNPANPPTVCATGFIQVVLNKRSPASPALPSNQEPAVDPAVPAVKRASPPRAPYVANSPAIKGRESIEADVIVLFLSISV